MRTRIVDYCYLDALSIIGLRDDMIERSAEDKIRDAYINKAMASTPINTAATAKYGATFSATVSATIETMEKSTKKNNYAAGEQDEYSKDPTDAKRIHAAEYRQDYRAGKVGFEDAGALMWQNGKHEDWNEKAPREYIEEKRMTDDRIFRSRVIEFVKKETGQEIRNQDRQASIDVRKPTGIADTGTIREGCRETNRDRQL